MRRYVFLLLSLYLLVACSAPNESQSLETTVPPTVTNTPEPTLTPTYLPLTPVSVGTPVPETSGVITADNVDRLTHIATWGDGNVTSAEYTQDGKYLLVGSLIGIHVYDATDFSYVDFIDVSREVLDIAVSPDGKYIAASTRDRVLLIDLAEKRIVREFDSSCRSCLRYFPEIVFSPDGQILTTANWDDRGDAFVQLWNVSDGKLFQELKASPDYFVDDFIHSIVFSPDGKYVVTGGNATRIWDMDGNQLDASGPYVSGGSTESLTFTPDGQFLIEGSDSSYIHLGPISETGQMLFKQWVSVGDSGVHSVAVSPNGNTLAASSWDGIFFWELPSGEPIMAYEDNEPTFRKLVWSPDGKYLISFSFDEGIEVWDATNGALVRVIRHMTSEIHDLDWSPTGELVAVGTREGDTYILDAQTGDIQQEYLDIYQESSVAFSPEGDIMAMGSDNSSVQIRAIDGTLINDLSGASGRGNPFAFSQNGDLLATHLSGEDYSKEYIQVWKTEDWSQRYSWDLGDIFIQTMAFSPDARWLVYTTLDDDAFVISTYTGKQIKKLDLPDYSLGSTLVFSPSGEYLAVLTNDFDYIYLNIWHIDNWSLRYSTELFSPEDGRGKSLGFHPPSELNWTPDSQLLAIGLPYGYIKIVDVAKSDVLHDFKAHTLWVTNVAFSPDGQILASGSLDGTVRLWGLK